MCAVAKRRLLRGCMKPLNNVPQQKINPSLRQNQQQAQTYSLSRCAGNVLKLLSKNAAQMTDYLRAEAERNPCVELTFPQAGGEDLLELLVAAKTDYREELLLQLPDGGNGTVLRIARALVDQLDEYGYLPFDPVKRCPETMRKETQSALRIVQSLEPAGVGARSLRECYWIQANRGTRPSEDVKALLTSSALFRLYTGGSFSEVCQRLGWEQTRLDLVTRILSGFAMHPVEPEPDQSMYVVPDVEIVQLDNGLMSARLFEHALPKVSLSASYVESGSDGGGRFVNEGVYYANRLIYCLERRNATLLSVLQFAVTRQMASLNGGLPERLTMSETAKALGLNRSTVCRAVAGKYALFHNRVFPVSELFLRAGKDGISRERACALIRERISSVQPGEKPPSDRVLSEELERRYGISLSRRTVNKYRAGLVPAVAVERNRP